MAVGTGARITRRQMLVTVGVTTVIWLLFSSSWSMLPLRLLVTLVHEAGHAIAVELNGGDVQYVIINPHGGGLTSWRMDAPVSATTRVLIASAGYVGTAIVGAFLLEGATHLRRGRIAAMALAAGVAAIGFAWVPLRVDPDAASAAVTGAGTGDGRFTVFVCCVAVLVLVGLAVQPSVRVRTVAVIVLATTLCLASIDDLRRVLDWSARGGHSDAASAAAVTPLSSWVWAAIWLLVGAGACALGLWAALSGDGSGEVELSD